MTLLIVLGAAFLIGRGLARAGGAIAANPSLAAKTGGFLARRLFK